MVIALLLSVSTLFNSGWTFSRDGGSPTSVDLPHDAAIAADFDLAKHSTGCGALPYDGHAEYAKTLVVSADEAAALAAGTAVWRLEFDGVMSRAKVFVNGVPSAERPNGYASFVVFLKGLRAGGNEIKVTADPPKNSSRWYPGMGIYRDVRLVKTGADFVVPGSVAIVTKSVEATAATVEATWEMSKGGAKKRTFTVERPQLWSPETPHLYTVELGGETFRYGIRTLRYSPTDGFFLNGRHRQMRGVCLHHDLGVFGTAFVREAARRQLEILKEMGCDAIRTSHNFPAPALLDLCDELGVMVLDEAFDEWKTAKVANGMAKVWADWHEREIVDFVRRDRNHPSVVMWSAGNELCEDEPRRNLAAQGVAIAKELTALIHANDPEGRPVTAGHWQPCTMTNGIGAATDVFGANYLPAAYAGYRGRQGIVGTETCSAVSTRGTFFTPIDNAGKYAVTNRVSDYGLVPMHGNDYPPDVEFAAQDANPHVYGEFVWTGFDYLGEPDPWRKTSRSSYFGIFDLCGFPKSRYWLYKSQWRPGEPLVHIVPHWNWKSGDVVPVHVFTSGDEVELFLNGRSLGVRRKRPGEYRLVWENVAWERGTLKAVAKKGGRAWAEDVRVTAGAFVKFVFADKVYGDYVFRTATAVDAAGNPVPDAAEEVPYVLPSGATLVGTCNGDPADLSSLTSARVKSFNGLALVVYRKNVSNGR